MRYKHTQIGWVMVFACTAVLSFVGVLETVLSPYPQRRVPSFLVGAILFVVMILFASLTVEVDDESISIRFGPGIIQKQFRLNDIAECKPVRNRWWMGWGIHGWPGPRGGWLFNVSGLDAVELRMKDGRVYRIGTDEPRALSDFIRAKLTKII